jgi:hypothetical protein
MQGPGSLFETLTELPAPWAMLAIASVLVSSRGGSSMAELRVNGAGSRSRVRVSRDVARWLGRAVLWLLVLVLLLRGIASVLEPRGPAMVTVASQPAGPSWSDDEVRAFAADFARAYLTYSASDPEASALAIRAFMIWRLDRAGVRRGCAARSARVGGARDPPRRLECTGTVAAAVTGGTRYLTVPAARDARGGLVVSDLPSLAAAPSLASVPAPASESLPTGGRGPIEDVVSRFLRAYLAGDVGELSFFTPSGARIGALCSDELVDVTSLALLTPPQGRERGRAGDGAEPRCGDGRDVRAALPAAAVREDRWLVAAVNTTKKAG